MARYINIDEYLKNTFCDKFDDCTSEEECLECWAKRNTEDVAPVVHSKWEELTDGGYLDPRMICSNCSNISTPLVSWKFCPNCGAKMDIE